MPPRARVLVVDDSVVVRQFLAERLSTEPDIEVIGVAANGRIALAKLAHRTADVLILDVEMPELDGLATLRELRQRPQSPRVIMFSAHTTAQARATVDALALGAEDCVAKPSNLGGSPLAQVAAVTALLDRIRMLSRSSTTPRAVQASPQVAGARTLASPMGRSTIEIVAIGASTGGPNALCQVFSRLPARFPVPVVIVQHMPVGFTKPFAERLQRESNISVEEGSEGTLLAPGKAWVAPAGRHMEVRRGRNGTSLHLHDAPPVWSCRPAVDVLFASVATAFPSGVLGVIMTGMGEDGRQGSMAIRRAGGSVIIQDQASSVVWGMAGAVASAGLAEAILPIDELGDEIVRRVRRGA